jgi:hypothetical protein
MVEVTLGFHGGEGSNRDLWFVAPCIMFGRIPTFRRILLPPSSPSSEDLDLNKNETQEEMKFHPQRRALLRKIFCGRVSFVKRVLNLQVV